MTADDLTVTLFFCALVPLVGLALFLALVPAYVSAAVWVLRLCGGA